MQGTGSLACSVRALQEARLRTKFARDLPRTIIGLSLNMHGQTAIETCLQISDNQIITNDGHGGRSYGARCLWGWESRPQYGQSSSQSVQGHAEQLGHLGQGP